MEWIAYENEKPYYRTMSHLFLNENYLSICNHFRKSPDRKRIVQPVRCYRCETVAKILQLNLDTNRSQ